MYYITKNNEHIEIDTNSIWYKSSAKCVIMLPYGDYADVKAGRAAEIRVDLPHPIEGIKLRLIVPSGDGACKNIYCIHAEDWEIIDLLDGYFAVTNGHQGEQSGLTPYWFGHSQANYLVWREVTTNPLILVEHLKRRLPDLNREAFETIEDAAYELARANHNES